MPKRTAPAPNRVTQPFFDSCSARAMALQRCTACDTWIFYPRSLCPHCFGADLAWEQVKGTGTLYSFIICHSPGPGFSREECPYVSAIVELDEGPRLHTNLIDVDPTPDAVRIGMRVEVVYEDCDDNITLPLFRPA